MLKEGILDYRRKRNDVFTNQRTVLKGQKLDLKDSTESQKDLRPSSTTNNGQIRKESKEHLNSRDLRDQGEKKDYADFRLEKWQNIAVGDIVKIQKDQMVPADIVVLDAFLCQDKECICYIDTYLVDGNKDLVQKQASSLTKVIAPQKFKGVFDKYRQKLTGKLIYEPHNQDVSYFNGTLKLTKDPQTKPITNQNFIPRGSILKSEGW